MRFAGRIAPLCSPVSLTPVAAPRTMFVSIYVVFQEYMCLFFFAIFMWFYCGGGVFFFSSLFFFSSFLRLAHVETVA